MNDANARNLLTATEQKAQISQELLPELTAFFTTQAPANVKNAFERMTGPITIDKFRRNPTLAIYVDLLERVDATRELTMPDEFIRLETSVGMASLTEEGRALKLVWNYLRTLPSDPTRINIQDKFRLLRSIENGIAFFKRGGEPAPAASAPPAAGGAGMAMYNNEMTERLAEVSKDINTATEELRPLLREYVRDRLAQRTFEQYESSFGTLTVYMMRTIPQLARIVHSIADAGSPVGIALNKLSSLESDKRDLVYVARRRAAPRKSRNTRRRKQRKTRRSNRR